MNKIRVMAMALCCASLLLCGWSVYADDSAPLPDPSRAKRTRPAGKKNDALPASPSESSGAAQPATHDSRLNSILEGLLELHKVPAQPSGTQSEPAPGVTKDTAKDVPPNIPQDAVQTALTLSRHELLFAYAAIGQVADLHIKEIYDRQWALTMLATYSKTLSAGRAAVENLSRGGLAAEEKRAAEGLAVIYELLLRETQAYKLFAESGDKNHLITFSRYRKDVQAKIQELAGLKRPTDGPRKDQAPGAPPKASEKE